MGGCATSQNQGRRGQEGYRGSHRGRAAQAEADAGPPKAILRKSLVPVRLQAYIDKKTIETHLSQPYLHEYVLTFRCSSENGCAVHVYFFCTESSEGLQFRSKWAFSGSETLFLPPGKDQLCSLAFPDFSDASLPDLTFAQKKVYPLVIVVTPVDEERKGRKRRKGSESLQIA